MFNEFLIVLSTKYRQAHTEHAINVWTYRTQATWWNPFCISSGHRDDTTIISEHIGRTGEAKQMTRFCSNSNLNKINNLYRHLKRKRCDDVHFLRNDLCTNSLTLTKYRESEDPHKRMVAHCAPNTYSTGCMHLWACPAYQSRPDWNRHRLSATISLRCSLI